MHKVYKENNHKLIFNQYNLNSDKTNSNNITSYTKTLNNEELCNNIILKQKEFKLI